MALVLILFFPCVFLLLFIVSLSVVESFFFFVVFAVLTIFYWCFLIVSIYKYIYIFSL